MRFRLLGCLAKAIAKNGVKFLCGLVPGGDVLFDVAAEAWEDYRQGRPENGLRAELADLAQAPAAEVQQEAQQAAASAHLPADAQRQLAAYLGQVPGMIRRSLRRPSDPTGTTVPADLSLRSPEDLLPFLPPSPPRFQAGMRPLPGVDWALEEPLGVGGFGEVWKARHAHLKSKPPVALKFCLDPSAARVLRNEAGVLDRLMQHGRLQGIVPLQQAYLDADPPCLEYEYVEGGDLTGVIREMHAQRGMTVATANRLLLRLADIIAAAHRAEPAIVHDDLKPSNILIRRAAEGLKLYVTDYGIGGLAVARAVKQTRQPTNSREQLMTEAVRGAYTPLYASLEQMTRKHEEPPDPRDDVHALGMIWYQLVTGELTMLRLPADWTDELRGRGLSEGMIRLLGTCLAKAEKRPASAGVLAAELRALTEPAAKPPPPPPPPPPPRKPARRSVWRQPVLWVVLSVLMLSAAVVVGFLWANRPTSNLPVPRQSQDYTNSLGMKFKGIEPGSFLMGSPDGTTPRGVPAEKDRSGDEIPHNVTLTQGFYLGVYPVTRGQFAVFVKDAGYQTEAESDGKGGYGWDAEKKTFVQDPKYTWRSPGFAQTDNDPVVEVSWNDAVKYCQWLSKKEGRTYELPTEAEWEYACRAGTKTRFWCGDDDESLQGNANIADASLNAKYPDASWAVSWDDGYPFTSPVGTFKANPWGLYDMSGNVWQWCADGYGAYDNKDIENPNGTESSNSRVLRGGSWGVYPRNCRSALRHDDVPGDRIVDFGFRVVLRSAPRTPQ